MNKTKFEKFLYAVLNNEQVSNDLKQEVFQLFNNYKSDDSENINKYIDLINEFIINENLSEVDNELSRALVYKGTLLRIHKDKEEVNECKWAAWTYDALYLTEINVSNNGLLLITSTSLYWPEDFGIRIDDFGRYLYSKGYFPEELMHYESEVIYPIRYNKIVADIIENTLDD